MSLGIIESTLYCLSKNITQQCEIFISLCEPETRVKLCFSKAARRQANSQFSFRSLAALVCVLLSSTIAFSSSNAPSWMHNLTTVPAAAYDDKTEAVQLYSETNVTVVSADRIKTQVREAYQILRPAGRSYGTVWVYVRAQQKVVSLHG